MPVARKAANLFIAETMARARGLPVGTFMAGISAFWDHNADRPRAPLDLSNGIPEGSRCIWCSGEITEIVSGDRLRCRNGHVTASSLAQKEIAPDPNAPLSSWECLYCGKPIVAKIGDKHRCQNGHVTQASSSIYVGPSVEPEPAGPDPLDSDEAWEPPFNLRCQYAGTCDAMIVERDRIKRHDRCAKGHVGESAASIPVETPTEPAGEPEAVSGPEPGESVADHQARLSRHEKKIQRRTYNNGGSHE